MRQKGRVEVGEDFWPIGFYSEIYFFIPIVAIEGAQMGQKSGPVKEPAEQAVREIRRATRRQFWAEEKIHIVLSGLRGEDSIAELCRREEIVQNLYYLLSLVEGRRNFSMPARSVWPAIRRERQPRTVKELRREASALKEVVAELTLENRLLKKTRSGLGRTVREVPVAEKLEIIWRVEQFRTAVQPWRA
jgi:transposase